MNSRSPFQNVLDERLDKRIDNMLRQGLLSELRKFYNDYKCQRSCVNRLDRFVNVAANEDPSTYSRGVLQTIGFKEFVPYLERFDAANDQKIEEYLSRNAYMMPTKEKLKANIIDSGTGPIQDSFNNPYNIASGSAKMAVTPPGLALLSDCLDDLKLVTRRYSKRQIKWINNRFLASKDRQVPDLYNLDTSDVAVWGETVYQRAVDIIDAYRAGQVCETALPMPRSVHPGIGLNEETSHFCPTCQRHFIGEFQWHLHLQSNKHKKRKEGARKRRHNQQ